MFRGVFSSILGFYFSVIPCAEMPAAHFCHAKSEYRSVMAREVRRRGTYVEPMAPNVSARPIYLFEFIMQIAVGIGGAEGDRTPDLDIANVALSQLSYCPIRPGARDYGYRRTCCQGAAEPG
jgi:hypothetical protein